MVVDLLSTHYGHLGTHTAKQLRYCVFHPAFTANHLVQVKSWPHDFFSPDPHIASLRFAEFAKLSCASCFIAIMFYREKQALSDRSR